ncbi:hypothetical protein [Nonlabens sp. Hel1_33_55]|nr:hypothetical protein [Nonlabens sp. Hel1_33_55]
MKMEVRCKLLFIDRMVDEFAFAKAEHFSYIIDTSKYLILEP